MLIVTIRAPQPIASQAVRVIAPGESAKVLMRGPRQNVSRQDTAAAPAVHPVPGAYRINQMLRMTESLSDIAVFVASVDGGRLTHAARVLGITPAAASAALKRLETQLGVRLILRTTRTLRLTQEGERYLEGARVALDALRDGRLALSATNTELEGIVRITAPADFGRNTLAPWLATFARQHPKVRYQLTLDDAVSDFFTSPVDLALRYGRPQDSSLVAMPLATLERVLCAAPSYLDRCGTPRQPSDLPAHETLCYTVRQRPGDRWLLRRGDEQCEIDVTPRWTFNDAEMVRRWAIRGDGIAYRLWCDVVDDIVAGRLVRVLPDWIGEKVQMNIVYPDRKLSPLCRALVDELTERCRTLRLKPG
ncbi:MAG: LysR family transcriptional regulator [Tahibacter sp.]